MKKMISLMLSLILPLSLTIPASTLSVFAEEEEQDNAWELFATGDERGTLLEKSYLYYMPNDDGTEIIISDCGTMATFADIPATINDLPVTTIAANAFDGCTQLTNLSNLKIPDSVKTIEKDAFTGSGIYTTASNWTDGVLYSGKFLLAGKPDTVSGDYSVKNGTTVIANNAFASCTSLTSVTIPEGVTIIGDYAFQKCTSITAASLPSTLASLGDHAFASCKALTSINIPDSITSIGSGTFSSCSKLATVTLSDQLTEIGSEAFVSCRALKEFTIPETVTSIGDSAFALSGLRSITLPKGITTFGDTVFSECSSLTSVVFEEGLDTIWDGVLSGCASVTEVTIPKTVTAIGSNAFSECVGLTEISIPSGVKTVGSGAFMGCTGLPNIVLPNTVTEIGDSVFQNCTTLSGITLSQGLERIGKQALANCSQITAVSIPNSVTSIGEEAFIGTALFGNTSNWTEDALYIGNNLIAVKNTLSGEYTVAPDTKVIADGTFKGCANLTAVNIPGGVKNIAPSLFRDCTGLTTVTMPSDITSIGDNAFYGCNALEDASLPRNVKTIGDDAYNGCAGLTEVEIPKGLSTIGAHAFANCTALTSMTLYNTVTSIGRSATNGSNALEEIHFRGTESEWLAIDGYDQFTGLLTVIYEPPLPAPVAESITYNGREQTGVPENDGYTLSGHTATNAGEYTATATLKDGRCWDDNTTEPKEVHWSIAPKEVTLEWGTSEFTYDGEPHVPAVRVAAQSLMGRDECTVTSVTGAGTDIGDYTATAVSLSNSNYKLPDNATRAFSIVPIIVKIPVASTENFVYSGREYTGVPEGMGYTITGNVTANAGEHTAVATLIKGNKWADDTTEPKEIKWTVKPLTAILTWAERSFPYDGTPHTPVATVSNLAAGDQCRVSVTGEGTYVGTYTVKATELDNPNYALPSVNTHVFTITTADDPAVINESATVAVDRVLDLKENITGAVGSVTYTLIGDNGSVSESGIYSPQTIGEAKVRVDISDTNANNEGENEYIGKTAIITITVTEAKPEYGVNYDKTTRKATIVSKTDVNNLTVIFAAYDNAGKLISTGIAGNEALEADTKKEVAAPPDFKDEGTVKLFLWNSLSDMTPVNVE